MKGHRHQDRRGNFEVARLQNLAKMKQASGVTVPLLLLSSGKIHRLSITMSSRALKSQRKQKSGKAIALPAPPSPWSLYQCCANFCSNCGECKTQTADRPGKMQTEGNYIKCRLQIKGKMQTADCSRFN